MRKPFTQGADVAEHQTAQSKKPMILGFAHVQDRAVITHRDSYLLSNLSVVSTRRPFFGGGVALGSAFAAFGLMFGDLLYAHEIAGIVLAASGAILISAQIGQLKLLSRDLKGTELSGALWGRYRDLHALRADIVAAVQAKAGTAGD